MEAGYKPSPLPLDEAVIKVALYLTAENNASNYHFM
jgi:hypothetical protein